jgi:hypothetical protein
MSKKSKRARRESERKANRNKYKNWRDVLKKDRLDSTGKRLPGGEK